SDLGVIAMPRGADVRLRVVDENAVPLPDVRIDVTRHEGGAAVQEPFWAWSMIEDRSDREGFLSLRCVPAPGSYSFAIGRGPSAHRVVRGADLTIADQMPIAADIVVGLGDTKDAMAGRVVDEHGTPVAGVTLSVAAEFLDLGSGVSGPDGSFRFDLGVPQAEHELYLPAEERRFRLLEPDRVYPRGATDLVVRVARNAVFDVPLQVVHARTGEPVTSYGVVWTLDYWTEEMRLAMPPDRIYRPVAAEPHADGRATLSGLLPGHYRACIWPGDRDLATSYLVPFEVAEGGAEPVRVEVDGRAPLRVALRDEAGAPIVGAEVGLVHLLLTEDGYPSVFSVEQFARGVGGGRDTAIQLQSRPTDRDGRVVLQAPIGEARLQLRVQDARCAHVAQQLAAAVPPEGCDVELTAQRCARIVGRLGPAEWVASVAPEPSRLRDDAIVRPEDSDLTCYCPVIWIEGIGENAPRGTRGFVMPDGTFHIDSVLPGDYRLMCDPDTCAWPGPRGDAIAFGELRGLVGGEVREVTGDAGAHRPARLRGTVLVGGQPWTRGKFGLAYRDDDRMRCGKLDLAPGGTFATTANPGAGYLPFVEWEDATGKHQLFADRRIDIAPGADLAMVFAFERHVGQLIAPKPGRVQWQAVDFPEVHALLDEWAATDDKGVLVFDPAPPGRLELVEK
ncbi:MAG: carboxypeptidase-like regulatory domain-containing protein, partial [Planctomycetota bacterium]